MILGYGVSVIYWRCSKSALGWSSSSQRQQCSCSAADCSRPTERARGIKKDGHHRVRTIRTAAAHQPNGCCGWSEEEEGLLLPKVWIRILRVPSRLREPPVLWALGSMVGATQMVDMVTSKNCDFGRVLVTVLDSKAIPGPLGVVIRDRWFEFPIEVNNINHGVESYVEISTDQGDKDDNNER